MSTDYSKMSDFEINKLVALASGKNIKFISVDADDNEIGVIVGEKCTRQRLPFDPCNSPADAWPIIVDNGISLECIVVNRREKTWRAQFKPAYVKHRVNHKNPLLAAMIVFLMMQEEK